MSGKRQSNQLGLACGIVTITMGKTPVGPALLNDAPRVDCARVPETLTPHPYKELLADPHLGVVFVLIPDHWHAQMELDAMRAGKDADAEKPKSQPAAAAKRRSRPWLE